MHGVPSPTQHLELDKRGADLLFQVLTDREETASVAIASNESFGGWTRTFTDPRLCAAIVDRLTLQRHHHRDQHPVLPPQPHPGPTSRGLVLTAGQTGPRSGPASGTAGSLPQTCR
ncbi:ATP-binding protein [Spirillospora sp. NPDC127506]